MSICTIPQALRRIEIAPRNSQIIVFKCDRKDHVNACYANTSESKRRIKLGLDIIGIFDKTSNPKKVQYLLEQNS